MFEDNENNKKWIIPMREAIFEARLAGSKNEVPVGAVVLNPQGEIIGRGHNTSINSHDPCAHAEIIALREACTFFSNYRLPHGSAMVVTLEPCLMCLGALIHARISTVVFGATELRTGCLGSRMEGNMLPWANHNFLAIGGILEQECQNILQNFFIKQRQLK